MDRDGVCFNCAFWIEHIARKDNPQIARIDGVHYSVGPEPHGKVNPATLGYGGARFKIRWRNGRTEVTNNLWCQGHIPEMFRDELPDNAIFLPTEEGVLL